MQTLNNIEQLQIKSLELIAKQIIEGFILGLHKSPYHGFSVEFAEHSIYNAGEPTRHIDWKLFARTEKLYVKKYEEETNLRSQILIDTSSSMQYPQNTDNNKLNYALYTTAALIHLLRKQRDAVGLTLFDENINLHTPSRLNISHTKTLFAHLDRLLNRKTETKQKTNLPEILHKVADTLYKRSFIILFTDLLNTYKPEELYNALAHLRHQKHEIIIFHIVDKSTEQQLNLQDRPYKFIDIETNEKLHLNPNQIREKYQQTIRQYHRKLKLKCAEYNIDFVEADIRDNFKQILEQYLLKRAKLF